ncbi:hypothetical protein cyc_08248 [Cyclospora cayetanensis]|uniref:Uncharacterized protein n=1 Tax=Cyclospora cayetanensis TaxID=88456 RepID=A0A1D3D0C2_9EIME|nr:hypothetical protein cyc_08248 [Cyclospora cayetanensis]
MASAANRGLLLVRQTPFPFLLLILLWLEAASPSACLSKSDSGTSRGRSTSVTLLHTAPYSALIDGVDTSVSLEQQAQQQPRLSPKRHVISVDELLSEVQGTHWEPLDVLLARGASQGALAKVVHEKRQKNLSALAATAAKDALEICQADGEAEACKTAKAHAKEAASARENSKIGTFSAREADSNAEDSTSSSSGELRSIREVSAVEQSADASSSMVEVSSIGSFWDTLFGGAGAGNAENFEGGNQGSYFNFMYPSDTDYPWACVCDEGQYTQWVNKQVQYVSCRNQVDLSSQNAVAMCNPQNHKINAATMASGSRAAAVAAIAAAAALAFVAL